MNQTVQIIAPGVDWSATGRKAWPDEIMSSGALVVVDHGKSGLSSVPANGGTFPNIAWKTAAAILGSGTQSSLAVPLYDNAADSIVLLEVSGKQGLHGISSQVSQVSTNAHISVRSPDAVRNYLRANPTHKYFRSWWGYVTRTARLVSSAYADSISSGSPSNRFFLGYGTASSLPAGNNQRAAVNTVVVDGNTVQNVGVFIRNATHNAFTGTLPATDAGLLDNLAHWGPQSGSSGTLNKGASWVHYRSVLIDMTVSGQSYAELDAIDLAMFNAAVLAPGGRFYGDTFTAPSTLP